MNVLILGNGGREHALAWKVAQSPLVKQVFVASGNAGTAQEPKVKNLPVNANDLHTLVNFAQHNDIDLTIVGPETPLVLGVVDLFCEAGLKCFGASKAAAQLEGSKAFTKDFLMRHNIPTARYEVFTELKPALAYLKNQPLPIVIKADGLAAGKGVVIAQTLAEANAAAEEMLVDNAFGSAGQKIVIEEFLSGEEASFICMVDGEHILPMATSQDHKARDDGDKGPNTGGMGAYSPAPVVTPEVHERVMTQIIEPTVRYMAMEGTPYTGFLYAGLMIDAQGQPKVLEYNCRFGDPETQVIMLRLKSDFVELCLAGVEQRLDTVTIEWDKRTSLGVVMATGGYPSDYEIGDIINGLAMPLKPDCKIFHAGTVDVDGHIVTAGGRVLCVTALGKTVLDAQQKAYTTVEKIHWSNVHYRKDIGHRAVTRLQQAKEAAANNPS